jgi:large subunit ribosomal protein L10e
MGLRKASAYSKKFDRPYTRKSNTRSKSYIKTIPAQRIIKFEMGNTSEFQKGKYKFIIKLMSKERVMVRDNAIEASRQVINKALSKVTSGEYYFAIKKYPHHILRENKTYSGASKGDRVNDGMSNSFGSVIGRAAFINPEDVIFYIAVEEKKFVDVARNALRMIKPKLPCGTKIITEKLKK